MMMPVKTYLRVPFTGLKNKKLDHYTFNQNKTTVLLKIVISSLSLSIMTSALLWFAVYILKL